MKITLPAIAVIAAAFAAHHADAGYLTLGAPFTVTETNALDNHTDNLTYTGSPLTTLIDNGKVSMSITELSLGGGKEWVLWSFSTVGAGPIAGDINVDWSMAVTGMAVTGSPTLAHFFVDWGINGNLISPISDVGINLPIEPNPVSGFGTVFGADFFIPNRTTAGGSGTANTFATLMTNNLGVNPNTVNFFQFGELLVPAPEPGTLALLGVGVLGIGLVRGRRAGSAPRQGAHVEGVMS